MNGLIAAGTRRRAGGRRLAIALAALLAIAPAVMAAPTRALAAGAEPQSASLQQGDVTPEEAYDAMVALRGQYPNGMRWTNDNYYHSSVLGGGYGCAGFAFILSDAAFGDSLATEFYDLSEARVGDILCVNNGAHYVIVLEVRSSSFVVAEGNINSSIYWGREISFSSTRPGFVYGITRYGDSQPVDTRFPDVVEGDWYHDSVMWVAEKGIMTGQGDGTFAPTKSLQRCEMAQLLWNMYGRPSADKNLVTRFPDCSVDEWYAEAVAWAYQKGAIGGYDDGRLGTSDSVTREQFATILWRLEGKPAGTSDLTAFPDASNVSEFSHDALEWAVGEGIITGDKGNLSPAKALSRAEAATMIMRWQG